VPDHKNEPGWKPAALGALRSELDEGADIASEFAMLESCAQALRHAYNQKRLTPAAAAELFASLRLEGDDGAVWTIGASSNSWYRRIGNGSWSDVVAPFGVSHTGVRPSWVDLGVGGLIAQAELAYAQANLALTGDGSEGESEKNLTTEYIVSNSTVNSSTVVSGVSMSGDVDWVFEEWDKPTAPAPMREEVAIGKVDLPERVPSAWRTDTSLDNQITTITGTPKTPAQRVGQASKYTDALDEEIEFDELSQDNFATPQDFFLPPEDTSKD
jgi:hypothetical protein